LPIVADLLGEMRVPRWVYYCVDDFAAWPGLDSKPMREMEDLLIRKASRIVAASEVLAGSVPVQETSFQVEFGPPASKTSDSQVPVLAYGVIRSQSTSRTELRKRWPIECWPGQQVSQFQT